MYGVQLPESKSISLSPLGGFASEDISGSELDDNSAIQYVESNGILFQNFSYLLLEKIVLVIEKTFEI